MKIVFNDKFLDTTEGRVKVGSIYAGRRSFKVEIPNHNMSLFRRIRGGWETLPNGKKQMEVDKFYGTIVWYSPPRGGR